MLSEVGKQDGMCEMQTQNWLTFLSEFSSSVYVFEHGLEHIVTHCAIDLHQQKKIASEIGIQWKLLQKSLSMSSMFRLHLGLDFAYALLVLNVLAFVISHPDSTQLIYVFQKWECKMQTSFFYKQNFTKKWN